MDMIEARTSQFWRATLALSLGSFMVFANVYVTQPMLPLFSREFAVSPLVASWSLSLTTLTLAFSLMMYGPLSDALGRRTLMVGSLCGVLLVTLLLGLVRDFNTLLILRVIQGLFLGGLPAIAIAYMGDEYTKPALGLAVGFYISGNTLGGIGGRLVGGLMTDLAGWQSAFWLMAALSLICLLAMLWLLPVPRHFSPKPLKLRAVLGDIARHLGNPVLRLAYLIGGLNFFIFINQFSYVTFVLSDAPYRLSATLLGMLFLCYLSGTLAAALSGKVSRYLAQPLCMLIGIGLLVVGTLVTLIPSLVAILLGLLINSFGFFFCHSMASAWVSHNASFARGSASSLYLVFYYIGASTGSFYLQPFWQQWGWNGVVVASLLVLVLTAAMAIRLWRREKSESGATLGQS